MYKFLLPGNLRWAEEKLTFIVYPFELVEFLLLLLLLLLLFCYYMHYTFALKNINIF